MALLVLLGLGAAGCASDKNIVSHAFNNVAARDNAYFLAREKLRGLEDKLYTTARPNDYNQTLPLFPTLDSTSVRASRADLNDIIKKASMPIQHRPGSDWTDDAYILVGWSRFYQMQFDDAALTFKYVNSTSKDDNAKHEALIGLMRTFVAQGELESAKAVSDLLDKEQGRPEDARQLFLTRADYFLRTEEPAKAIAQLEKAVPLIEAKNERSRTRYILAQLYQDAGENKKAYEQLDQILARNPPYELDFQAKLMLPQVSELNTQDRARLDKVFAGLLKDLKNKDYRDKIYYEMARLNYREKNYPDALKLLGQSVRATTTNRYQKSYAYLLAGRIYYENLHKYPLAAAYYDSTVQTLSKEAKTYAAIKERSDILKNFAKQYTIIETEDSLQALARLTPEVLNERLNTYADAELAERKRQADRLAALQKNQARAAEIAGRSSSASSGIGSSLPSSGAFANGSGNPASPDATGFDPTATASAGQWYFDNPVTLGTARSEFIRKWGNRQLQDNWRTNRQASSSPNLPANGNLPLTTTGNGETLVNGTAPASPTKPAEVDPNAARNSLATKYRGEIPTTESLLSASNQKVEAAMYELGGIYKEQLKEREKGFGTYEKQVVRYPRGEHAADAYYLLYLYYKDLPDAAKTAEYAAALQREFPNSIYAKLIADPLYREHELALHNAVAARVDSAFTYYKGQEFRKTAGVLARTEKLYPKNDLTDRVAYLKTLLAVRTQPPVMARTSVEKFIRDNPESALVPQAQALAASYKKQESGELAGALASTEKPVISQFRPGEVDNRMRIFYKENESPAKALGPNPTGAAVPTPAPAQDQLKPAAQPEGLVPSGSAGPAPMAKPASEAPASTASPAAGTPPPLATTPGTAPAMVAVRKGRPTRKQLAEEAAAKKAAAAASPATSAPTNAPAPGNSGIPAAGATAAPNATAATPGSAASPATAPVRKGRPTRKQLADEAAARKAAAASASAGAAGSPTTGSAPATPTTVPAPGSPTASPADASPATAATPGAPNPAATTAATTPAVRKGRPTRKQLADEAAAKKAAATAAAATAVTAPAGAASSAPPAPAPAGTTAPVPAAPAAPAVAYTAQLSTPHAVVLVLPRDVPAAASLGGQLGTYNTRYFKANALQVETQPLGSTQQLVIIKSLGDARLAQSYATKLRGPQSPVSRLRGVGFQTVVITLDNLALLQASGDVSIYQAFYQKAYR